LLSEEVIAIFCPDSRSTAHAVMQICQQHAIPCLTAQWDATLGTNAEFNVTVNLQPTVSDIGDTLAAFLQEAQGWDQLGLIYTNEDSRHFVINTQCQNLFHSGGKSEWVRPFKVLIST
uniref:ANF_receptor domain-containing protein n=1 Tax=Rodentolepis nana TaxID=102285 RepID=A0A0R3THA1_RODNA